MIKNCKAYKNTSIHWSKTQGEIIQLLEKHGITETRFTNIGFETAKMNGLVMEKDSSAIMLEFMKSISVSSGMTGNVPIKIVIPSVPNDERYRNQAYRIFHWYLKTKFEAIATGLIEFEQEFMPHIAIGKGGGTGNLWQTFKQKLLPSIMSGENADVHLLEPPKK